MGPEVALGDDSPQLARVVGDHEVTDALAREEILRGRKVQVHAGREQRLAHDVADRRGGPEAVAHDAHDVPFREDADRAETFGDDHTGDVLLGHQGDGVA